MENTYFLSLKEKYSSPQEAYRAYTLQKTLWRVCAVSPTATQDVKDSFALQEKLNNYLEKIVTDQNIEFGKEFTINSRQMIDFIKENLNKFEFLGIDRNQAISLASDKYSINLYKASNNIISWTQLEQLITEEKYIHKPESKEDIVIAMNTTIENCGLTSIIGSMAITTKDIIMKVDDNFNQLATVVGCDKSQIGGNIFSVALSTEPDNGVAGYSNQYFKDSQQKLYVDALILEDAFAHEWMHGIDNIWARKISRNIYHASETGKTVIENLLIKAQLPNTDIINEIKNTVEHRTRNFCKNIVERYDNLGKIINKEQLLEFIDLECNKIMSNTWDKKEFHKNLEQYKHPEISGGFQGYITTELQLLKHMVSSEDFKHSVFYSYALKMDKNLVDIMGSNWSTYSVEKCEQLSRLFESYCDVVLKEKGMRNTISDVSRSFYLPAPEESKNLINEWRPVMDEIKNIIEEICPLKKKIEDNSFKLKDWNATKSIIGKLRENINAQDMQLAPAKLKK